MTMSSPEWLKILDDILSVVQKSIVVITAVGTGLVVAIKLKLYQLLEPRYRTEMQCGHQEMPDDGGVVFWAEYSIFNTGDLPLHVELVRLELRQHEEKGCNLVAGEKTFNGLLPTVIARESERSKYDGKAHFKPIGAIGSIGKGERSIFTLRCRVPALPDVVFVAGEFWKRGARSRTSVYNGMYVKSSAKRGAPYIQAV